MSQHLLAAICLAAAVAGFGCNISSTNSTNSTKSQLAQAQAELAKTRHELKAAQEEIAVLKAKSKPAAPAKAMSYIEELERLDALRTKKVLTPEEFEAKKKAVMQAAEKLTAPTKVGFTVDELAQQFRTLQGLYNATTITNVERDQKMQQLIDGPLSPGDLKTDLEAVQGLYNETVINNVARDALKKKILEREPTKP